MTERRMESQNGSGSCYLCSTLIWGQIHEVMELR